MIAAKESQALGGPYLGLYVELCLFCKVLQGSILDHWYLAKGSLRMLSAEKGLV